MVLTAAMSVPIIQQFAQLFGQANKKDQERYTTAKNWYTAAIAGDATSLCMLRHMGGLRGTGTCGGQAASGFATPEAKAFAEACFQQASAVLAGTAPMSSLPPAIPDAKPNSAGTVLSGVSQLTGAAATGLGSPPPTTSGQLISLGITAAPYLLLGVLVFAGYMLFKRH